MGRSLAPLLNRTAEPAIVSHCPIGRPIAEPAVLLNRSEHIYSMSEAHGVGDLVKPSSRGSSLLQHPWLLVDSKLRCSYCSLDGYRNW